MRVTAVGLGKLGLPWSLIADAAGHDVIGVDLDSERVEAINHGRVATVEPGVADMLADVHCRLRATSNLGNVGSDRAVSINELVDIVEQFASVSVRRRYLRDAPLGVRGRNSDNSRARERLGWSPAVSLEDGLEATYRWIYDQLAVEI